METFSYTPPVVPALDNNVDLFPKILPDISRPQFLRLTIPAKAPCVPHAKCPDFRSDSILEIYEWIVLRNSVLKLFFVEIGSCVDVNPKYLSKQRSAVLSIIVRVVCGAAIAEGNIKESVRPEADLPSIMIGVGLRNFHQLPFARKISLLVGRFEFTNNTTPWVLLRVVHVKEPICGEARVKREPEQAFFVIHVRFAF